MANKISFNDFSKVELKVGKILEVQDHPNADKLFVLKVDLGEETPRKICAGLKEYYKKEELKNKLAVFVANLEPRTLRGVESNGMILAAVSDDEVKILSPEKEVPIGTKVS